MKDKLANPLANCIRWLYIILYRTDWGVWLISSLFVLAAVSFPMVPIGFVMLGACATLYFVYVQVENRVRDREPLLRHVSKLTRFGDGYWLAIHDNKTGKARILDAKLTFRVDFSEEISFVSDGNGLVSVVDSWVHPIDEYQLKWEMQRFAEDGLRVRSKPQTPCTEVLVARKNDTFLVPGARLFFTDDYTLARAWVRADESSRDELEHHARELSDARSSSK